MNDRLGSKSSKNQGVVLSLAKEMVKYTQNQREMYKKPPQIQQLSTFCYSCFIHCSPSPHTLLSSLVSDSVCNSGLALSLMPLFFAYCFALFLWSFFFEIGKLEDSRVYVFKRFLTHDTRVHIRKVNSWWSVPPWSGSKKGQGTSLVVQWLGLGSFTAGARIWSLVENWDPTCLEGGPKNWGAWGWRTRGEAKDF